jgi:hypothetical protein
MVKTFSINVVRKWGGYSFAVIVDTDDEGEALRLAEDADLFTDVDDVFYATAEDITNSEYDLNGLKSATYDLTK